MKRKRYDDQFRASAVVMLEAAGYPHRKGALMQVSAHIGIPHPTLSRWYNARRNPPPDNLVREKRLDLKNLLRAEIDGALAAMPGARAEASYRDLGTVAAILVDKLQLLEGKPTENLNVTDDRLTDDDRVARIAALAERARTRRTGQPVSELVQ